MAHVSSGTVTGVGHGLHDNGNAGGAIAFVGDGLIVVTGTGAGGLLQHALDVIVGHVGGLGLDDDSGQAGVVGGIGRAAFLHSHDELLGDLGKGGSALGVLCALGLLYVMPFRMSGHKSSFLPVLVHCAKYFSTDFVQLQAYP